MALTCDLDPRRAAGRGACSLSNSLEVVLEVVLEVAPQPGWLPTFSCSGLYTACSPSSDWPRGSIR